MPAEDRRITRLEQLGIYDKTLGRSVEGVVLKQAIGDERKIKYLESENNIQQKDHRKEEEKRYQEESKGEKDPSQGGRRINHGPVRNAEQQKRRRIICTWSLPTAIQKELS